MEFHSCKLKPGLLKALDEIGYTKATPIQEQVLVPALAGKNIVGQSQTGTGKTTAFLLPLLQRIDTNKKGFQALILAPTRELVNQIGEEIFKLTKYYRVNAVCVYGGAGPEAQKSKLRRGGSIIVATPGRLMDFMQQGVIKLDSINFFVLDEVDRMLDMGFVRDIKKIRAQMKHIQQTYTFSATISTEIKKIIDEQIRDHVFVKVGDVVTVDKIHHSYIPVEHEHKIANVRKLIDSHKNDKIIIFTQTKRNTKSISTALSRHYRVGMLNGDMSQGKRNTTLASFKSGDTKILVTTDVAARGLNMDNVGLVINFDVPNDTESYIHRIGRTGRAGAKGKAVMLVSPLENDFVKNIERAHKIRIDKSGHDSIIDKDNHYTHIKLDRSTDKKGGRQQKQTSARGTIQRTPRPSGRSKKPGRRGRFS